MKSYDYDCPIEVTLSIISGKWKIICIYYLMEENRRFKDLMQLLETVSSRMLAKQLQELEADGIVKRRILPKYLPGLNIRSPNMEGR